MYSIGVKPANNLSIFQLLLTVDMIFLHVQFYKQLSDEISDSHVDEYEDGCFWGVILCSLVLTDVSEDTASIIALIWSDLVWG